MTFQINKHKDVHEFFMKRVLVHENSQRFTIDKSDNDIQPVIRIVIGPDSDIDHYDFFIRCEPYLEPGAKLIFWKPEEAHIIIINEIEQFKRFHEFSIRNKYPMKDIYFVTGNFRAQEAYDNWFEGTTEYEDRLNIVVYEKFSNTIINNRIPKMRTSKRKKHYISLNRVAHPYRAMLYMRQHDEGMLDKSLVSFHNLYSSDYVMEELLSEEIKLKLPITVDSADVHKIDVHHRDNSVLFKQGYFSLVTESVFDREFDEWPWWCEGFLTEKTFKTIYNYHPFIMAGAPGSLRRLHELGFKTFDGFIDESYDNEFDDEKRMDMIMHEMRKLCALSIEELHEWYHAQFDTLVYNQSQLIYDNSRLQTVYNRITK